MADKKVSQLTALTGANTASGDLLYIVDVSEPLPADQSKKITLTEFQSAPISAGTANGLLYLNASKVPTSGAGLTYDGTDLTVVGAVNAGSVNTTTLDLTNLEVTNIKAKDGTAAATIADATGKITVSTELAVDNLNLSGNTLASTDTNGNIVIAPNGTGDVQLDADTVRVGDANSNALITTNGTGDLVLNTNSGTNSGFITIEDGVNGNIIIAPNGTGQVQITNAALDLTTIEVTNIKAKDGTAAMTLADSTGVTTFAANPILDAGTANGVAFLNASKVLTTGSALSFDGSRVALSTATANIQLTTTVNTNQAYLSLADADGRTAVFRGPNSGSPNAAQIGTTTNHDLIFLYGNAEAMRLASTGLGIGTTSPSNKFVVSDSGANGLEINPTSGVSSGASLNGYNRSTSAYTPLTYAALSHYFQVGSSPATAVILDSSGNLTLNSATANGVGYFNGSKVLTTGSALTFDGSQLGIGISPAYTLHAAKTSGYVAAFRGTTAAASGILVGNTAGDTAIQTLASGDSFIFSDTSKYLAFGVNGGSEQMRLTSTGLGIGTSSPAYRLDVAGSTTTARLGKLTITNDTPFYTGANLDAGSQSFGIGTSGAGIVGFLTNNNERVRITTDGYVGIRTSSPAGFLHVAPGNAASSGAGAPIILQAQTGGASASGGNILIGSGQNGSGGSNGYIAFGIGSSTSGGAFATGEAMRITSAGNFGFNLNTPTAVLSGSNVLLDAGNANGAEYIARRTGGGAVLATGVTSSNTGYLWMSTNTNLLFGTNNTERARITSDGDLLVGTGTAILSSANRGNITIGGSASSILALGSAQANALYIYTENTNADVWNTANGFLRLGTNNTERVRITNAGFVGIGTTSPAATLHVSTGTTTNAVAGNAVAGFTASANSVISFNVPDANAAGLFFGYGGNAYWAGIEKSGSTGLRLVSGGNMTFSVDGAEAMRLVSGNNLLIGTTTARNRLTVQGTVFSTPTLGTASGQGFFGEAAGYGMMLGTSGFGYGWIQQQRVDGTAQAYDLLIQPMGGYVGIGTGSTTPTAKMTVQGAAGNGNALMSIDSVGADFVRMFADSTFGSAINWSSGDALRFATSDASFGTFTERARITSSGQFLLGTTDTGLGRFALVGPNASAIPLAFDTNASFGQIQTYSSSPLYINPLGNSVVFCRDSGGVSIGQTEVTQKLNVYSTAGSDGVLVRNGTNSQYRGYYMGAGATDNNVYAAVELQANSGELRHWVGPNSYGGFQTFFTAGVEAMRIDSSQRLIVNGSTPFGNFTVYGNGSPSGLINTYTLASSGTRYHIVFYESGTERGSVTSTGGGVVYNSTSDYRMKENVAPMSGALAKILQLKPCTYTWKNTGSAGEGFIAHELAEVFPNAVTGEKDAVKSDGSIKPQGVDTSMLVAALVSAIQELKSEFDAYKSTHP